MSAKAPPQTADDEEVDNPYEFDDDDDDDEQDFMPGMDEDDGDDDDDVAVLDGILSMGESNKLHYKGNGFHLISTKSVQVNGDNWNPLDATTTEGKQRDNDSKLSSVTNSHNDNVITMMMEGECESAHRKFEVQWTKSSSMSFSSNHDDDDDGDNRNTRIRRRMKTTRDASDDGDDDEKAPSLYCNVFGREQVDDSKTSSSIIEFRGGYFPPSSSSSKKNGEKKEVHLACQIRQIMANKTNSSVACSPAAASAKPAPAAAAVARRGENDDDEEFDDADEELDYDELIALHQDAGLSVDALRKRYQDNGGETNDEQASKKKAKPKGYDELDDDELAGLQEDAGLSVDALKKRYRDKSGDVSNEPDSKRKAKPKPPPSDDDDDDYAF